MLLTCPISNGMFPSQRAATVLLERNKNFIFIMELYKFCKIGRKSSKSSLQSKTQTLHILNIMIPSWFSKIVLGSCNMVCHILWGFRGNFYQTWTRLTRETKKMKVQILQDFLFLESNSHPSKKVGFICFNKSPLKMVKNAFYFILKILFCFLKKLYKK